MATFHFELVSPDKISFSGEVDQVDVPGSEGDFGVLAGHAPLIALLRPGLMTVYVGGEQTKLVVLGGFAEVGPDGLTVLADVATRLEDFDRAALHAQIVELEARIKDNDVEGSALDREIAKLDHFKAMDTHLDSTAMH
jgi:F-type H+-transporting ATPase subunit epsilon